MTDREKAIVMAHTGICMLCGDKYSIYTHELSCEDIQEQIKEKSRTDFIRLCRTNNGKPLDKNINVSHCPKCGADMRGDRE